MIEHRTSSTFMLRRIQRAADTFQNSNKISFPIFSRKLIRRAMLAPQSAGDIPLGTEEGRHATDARRGDS